MIYFALKKLLQGAFFFFFRKRVVNGIDNIPTKGPLIVAVNHPNTLIDPLLVGVEMKRRVGFLANASIFVNALIKKIFEHFWVIPIYRKKDLKQGEVQDNRSSFKSCYDFFDLDGALLIFPEGTSVNELKLRDIKTGTARIALSYEAERNFDGGLVINTIAISYSDSLRFRSAVSMSVNPAFYVSEYKDAWEEDNENAVRLLTDRIRQELQGLLTITDDKGQEKAVLQTQKFYTEYIDTKASRFSNPALSFSIRKEIASRIRILNVSNNAKYLQLAKFIETFFTEISALNLTPGFFRDSFLDRPQLEVMLSYIAQLILLFPLYILGLITSYIPYQLPRWIYSKLKVEEEYRATILLLGGMIIFPLYYMLNAYLFHLFISDNWILILLFILLLPFIGFVSLFFYNIWKRFLRVIHFYYTINSDKIEDMILKRDKIIKDIKEI